MSQENTHIKEPKYFKVSEVANYFNVDRKTIYRLINEGKIAVNQISEKTTRIAKEEIERYEKNTRKICNKNRKQSKQQG